MSAEPLHPATLRRRWDEAVDLVGLAFEPDDPAVAASFTQPGQYLVVQVGGPAGPQAYFAIASRPGDAHLDLLVKGGPGDAAQALLALAPGDRVALSTAQGQGFPVQAHAGKDVLLLGVGSGISPIRSLAWWLAAHRADYAGVTLFHGGRTRAHLAYRDEVEAWRAEGIAVVQVLSQEPASGDPGFAEGYVQQALAAHPVDPANTVAFVCGMPAMVEGVKAALAARGVGAEAVIQNY
jgi:NAD(P)H-flavin reductase